MTAVAEPYITPTSHWQTCLNLVTYNFNYGNEDNTLVTLAPNLVVANLVIVSM